MLKCLLENSGSLLEICLSGFADMRYVYGTVSSQSVAVG